MILDEFDALGETFINQFANEFRDIYIRRANETNRRSGEKSNLLHGLALVGVRAVLGIENVTGSPFNVQRSLHIPNLTFSEVESMFKWYEQEREQCVEQAVIERLFYEVQGHPGLTSWFGELLTETYNQEPNKPITMDNFEEVFAAAIYDLPNNHILNIVSKANQEPYKHLALEMFQTDTKLEFAYDDPLINFLYLNGVVDREIVNKTQRYLKFSCPFVQKRLFNYFAREMFRVVGQVYQPFEKLEDIITAEHVNIANLLKRYQRYLQENRAWLLQDAPRRKDLRIYEAVFHFNLYMYLREFFKLRAGAIYPEFPTGNGKIDLIITYAGKCIALK